MFGSLTLPFGCLLLSEPVAHQLMFLLARAPVRFNSLAPEQLKKLNMHVRGARNRAAHRMFIDQARPA